jgi:protein SCO1/2
MSNVRCQMRNVRHGKRRVVAALRTLLAFCLLHLAFASAASAQGPNFFNGTIPEQGKPSSLKPEQLKEVSFRQRLNERLPMDARFKDEYGRDVTLAKYFNQQRPVIVAFVYYQCPMLCTQVMNGISSALRALTFTAGEEFDVVLISFDPRDTAAAAAEKKRTHLKYWASEQTSGGWHFLTGEESTIKRVADAAGFTYQWDAQTQQFAHVSGVLVTTPDGKLARYFYGVEYSPKELRMALVEAGQGHIGSPIDELLLYCYHYDPESGRYGVMIMNLVRAAGILTLASMVGFIVMARRRDNATAHP